MIKRQTEATTRSAFTLMEMMVVVAILVVLAGAAIPIYLTFLDNTRTNRAKTDIKTLENALEAFSTIHGGGDYPDTWAPLLQPQEGGRAVLTPESLIDPWGREYLLDVNQRHPTSLKPKIYSQGPRPGDPNGMISNW